LLGSGRREQSQAKGREYAAAASVRKRNRQRCRLWWRLAGKIQSKAQQHLRENQRSLELNLFACALQLVGERTCVVNLSKRLDDRGGINRHRTRLRIRVNAIGHE